MQRRHFLKQTGLLTAGALSLAHGNLLANGPQKTITPFGVQLFSVRTILPNDPKGVMTDLAKMGYKQFESFSGAKGFLWGMEPKEIKSFLDGLGVNMISTHFNYGGVVNKPDELKKQIEMAHEAGLKYMLCPYIGAQKSWDDWKKIADRFNEVGEQVSKAGLKFGYHNHDYSFKPLDGKLPQDFLLENTDPKHVVFELDLCWIDVAGVDTAAHLKKYGKRYELCHIKDYKKEGGKPVQDDLGKGTVDFKKTLRLALASGIDYYIVEQEEYPQSPLVSLKNDAEYMKKLSV
ncbi:sugar phosphate isomerase/epimerase family protein [Larkinella insperata]|uniref:Sugar phosphate isomerase/epimerase family protein n=1 Tax=Larkinella insperata TaxID=332158 RepID=A0ABW3Q666_9BACT